jgi:hypothetical protein
MNCPNCNSQLSCGCQQRKASDGKAVCTNCLPFYEGNLKSEPIPSADGKTNVKVLVNFMPETKLD